MIVDTSVLVAIIRHEPERMAILTRVTGAANVRLSAASYLELGIVIDSLHDPVLSRQVDMILARLGVEVIPVDAAQATTARAAHRDFGKGSGHPARLNVGDCFSYALARELDDELLFVGNDFTYTDVRQVVV